MHPKCMTMTGSVAGPNFRAAMGVGGRESLAMRRKELARDASTAQAAQTLLSCSRCMDRGRECTFEVIRPLISIKQEQPTDFYVGTVDEDQHKRVCLHHSANKLSRDEICAEAANTLSPACNTTERNTLTTKFEMDCHPRSATCRSC